MSEFVEFAKIARLSRDVVVTEKIDGTNAQVFITLPTADIDDELVIARNMSGAHDPTSGYVMLAGSRNHYLTPKDDNFGFARWVGEHASELFDLGEGRHFGEWWGSGIQRGYGLTKGEKRFSLFNVARWSDDRDAVKFPVARPDCCHVVPVLYRGSFDSFMGHCPDILDHLHLTGSHASPGFMKPEGIVIYHTAGNVLFKKTLEKDEEPKSQARSKPRAEVVS